MGAKSDTDLVEVSEEMENAIKELIANHPSYGYGCCNDFVKEAVTRFLFQESQ